MTQRDDPRQVTVLVVFESEEKARVREVRKHAPHVSAVLVLPGHVCTGMPAPPRSWRRALNSLFADYQPVSSKQAGGRGDP